jgi:hypothetical protein
MCVYDTRPWLLRISPSLGINTQRPSPMPICIHSSACSVSSCVSGVVWHSVSASVRHMNHYMYRADGRCCIVKLWGVRLKAVVGCYNSTAVVDVGIGNGCRCRCRWRWRCVVWEREQSFRHEEIKLMYITNILMCISTQCHTTLSRHRMRT